MEKIKKITKKELMAKLKELQQSDDHEASHIEADNLLLQFIGDKDITQEFNKLETWCA